MGIITRGQPQESERCVLLELIDDALQGEGKRVCTELHARIEKRLLPRYSCELHDPRPAGQARSSHIKPDQATFATGCWAALAWSWLAFRVVNSRGLAVDRAAGHLHLREREA